MEHHDRPRPTDRQPKSDGTAGRIELTEQAPATAIATVDLDDRPPSEVWADLATSDGFRRALVEAVRELLAGTHHAERARTLRDAGATAADGGYATVATALDRAPDDPYHAHALTLTAAFGQPQPSIVAHLPLEAVREGPLALLDAAPSTPTVAIRVRHAFRERRADQRRRTCELVAWLAEVADVRLVASGFMSRYLATKHRADLPGSISEQCSAGRGGDPAAARLELAPDGREVAILRDLADEPTETLSYGALRSLHSVSSSRVSQCVGRLADLGLVDRFDAPRGLCVEILDAGRTLVETLETEIGRQRSLGDVFSETGKRCASPVYTAPALGTTPQGKPDDQPPGRYDAAYLKRWHHAAAVGSAVDADVTLVDTPIDALPVPEDPREPGWSFDDGTLVVSVAYGYSALQFWVRSALGLANWRTFEHVLTPEVLDEILTDHPRSVLRGSRQLGYLKDEYADGEAYTDALLDAAEHINELTQKRHYGEFEDRAEGASIITRNSLGLSTLMVHLLDLAGVDVVREVRLPEFSRNYGDEDRAEVARSIAVGLAQQSTYAEHHVAYRHLFESRTEKRRSAFGVDVDATDPLAEPIGSWVVVGPGVEGIEADVRRAIRHPADLHDDAPEFAVSVQVATPGRPAFATTTRTALRAKNLDATREAVSVLEAFTGSPYDAARAINFLESEEFPREVRLDEIRYALGRLPSSRILPEAAPTVSKVVRALLTADGPLNQTELAEAADVSARSIRTHADHLKAFDLLRTPGDTYRLSLSHRGERYRDVLPWFARPNREREDYRDATERGVLWEVIDAELPDVEAVREVVATVDSLQVPPDVRAEIVAIWPWAGPLLDVVRSFAAEEIDHRLPTGRPETFGADVEQSAIVEATASTGSAVI